MFTVFIINFFLLIYSLLWVPAPPKLSFHPSTVQSYLFPDYRSSAKPTTLWTSPWQHIIGFKRTAEHEENTQPESYQKKYANVPSNYKIYQFRYMYGTCKLSKIIFSFLVILVFDSIIVTKHELIFKNITCGY